MLILLVDSERGFFESIQCERVGKSGSETICWSWPRKDTWRHTIHQWMKPLCVAHPIICTHYIQTHIKRREDNKNWDVECIFMRLYISNCRNCVHTFYVHWIKTRTNDNAFRIDLGYFPLGYWNFTFQIIYIMFVTLEFRERERKKIRIFCVFSWQSKPFRT